MKQPNPLAPRFRSVDPLALAQAVATVLHLAVARAQIAARVVWFPHAPPTWLPYVDADALLVWLLAGLRVFTMVSPSYRDVVDMGGRALLVLTLARTQDSLSELGRVLDCSRKVARERLRRFGLYPPARTAEIVLGDVEPTSGSIVRAYASAVLGGLGYLMQRASLEDRAALSDAAVVVERLGREG